MLALLTSFVLQGSAPQDFTKDLDELITDLKADGAYVRDDGVDFARLEAVYRPRFAAAATTRELLPVLESFVAELHDFHAFVGTNNASSPRLVPSGTDLVGEWRGERAFVAEVRQSSRAEAAGLRAGDEILEVNGLPVRAAARSLFGVLLPGERGWGWALDAALAGRWDVPRRIRFCRDGADREVTLETARTPESASRLTAARRADGVLVLRPEDSLGQNDLLKDFARFIPDLRAARGIVLDLRNTPSGGNTTVARGIMGLFIGKRLPYQRHLVEERDTNTVRDWVEYATPRLSKPVGVRLVVLVDRWTGSMGEGLAVGFDAMRRGTVVGTRMAGLRGAVNSTTLPVSGLHVFFPTERLFHIEGIPRDKWLPPVRVVPGIGDPWMAAAERILDRRQDREPFSNPLLARTRYSAPAGSS